MLIFARVPKFKFKLGKCGNENGAQFSINGYRVTRIYLIEEILANSKRVLKTDQEIYKDDVGCWSDYNIPSGFIRGFEDYRYNTGNLFKKIDGLFRIVSKLKKKGNTLEYRKSPMRPDFVVVKL